MSRPGNRKRKFRYLRPIKARYYAAVNPARVMQQVCDIANQVVRGNTHIEAGYIVVPYKIVTLKPVVVNGYNRNKKKVMRLVTTIKRKCKR